MGLLGHGASLTWGVLGGALGQRVQQTAHPQWFNAVILDPDSLQRDRLGQDGDTEYALWAPDPDCVYNGRAVDVYLPEGFVPAAAGIDRLRTRLEFLRALTCTTRVAESRGPERLVIPASGST